MNLNIKKILLIIAYSVNTEIYATQTERFYSLQVKHSGKCLVQSNRPNGPVTQADCKNDNSFKIGKGFVKGTYYTLYAYSNYYNLCLTVKDGKAANGAAIVQQECNGKIDISQQWRIIPVAQSYVKIQSALGLCMHQLGGTMNNGDPITLWECVDQPNVLWKMIKAP